VDEAMPRRSKGPRLHWDKVRKQWVIRDGQRYKRIERGADSSEQYAARAEKELRNYIGDKHQPQAGLDPLIVDVLLAYAKEVVPNLAGAKNTAYNIDNLSAYWGAMRVSDITSQRCREYASMRSSGGARRDLEVLRAAVRHWNEERGLDRVPVVTLPEKGEARERWLTRTEAARLLWAVWRYREVQKGHETDKHRRRHLARLIMLCLYTGSRPGVILALQWAQINFAGEYMLRRPAGVAENKRKRTPRVRVGPEHFSAPAPLASA
jgi:integrase